MNLKILILSLASLSVFFTLQALYWWRRTKRVRREELVASRLGFEEEERDELVKTTYESGLANHIVTLMRAAGEPGDVSLFVQRAGLLSAGLFLGSFAAFQSLFISLSLGVAGVMIFYSYLTTKRDKRVAKVELQLPEALEMMIISLRAGQSLDQAFALNAKELPSPISEEFKQVSEETRLGLPMDEALKSMVQRLDQAKTMKSFVISVLVLRQTGGNLVEVLEAIIDGMRQQAQYEHKLRSMTAEARANAKTLGALPPLFVLISRLINDNYFETVTSSNAGIMMMVGSGIFYVLGFLWVRALVKPNL